MAITNINPEELKAMLQANPTLQLLDVRSPEEFYYLGHLPQAQLMPLQELPTGFRRLDPKETLVITCQHGIRSTDACYFLQAQGFESLFNLEEGMASWEGPVERDLSAVERMFQSEKRGE